MTDSQQLQFDLFDRLADDFGYWHTIVTVNTGMVEEYFQTGDFPNNVAWAYAIERFFSIWIQINTANAGEIVEEINANIFRINNDGISVRYLNKWADLSNRILSFAGSEECTKCLESNIRLKETSLTDPETLTKFCERMTSLQSSFIELSGRIAGEVKNTLWYKQHPELIRVSYQNHFVPQPTEPGVKLQWNGTNRALYDLFAQLSLTSIGPNKSLIGNTITGLAQFLAVNVEGLPDVATIERELQKMREPQGIEKAKRGRIDLNITKGDN